MEGTPADLRVLTDYREQLVAERTATANRVHAELGWLGPGYQQQVPRLTPSAHLHAALALLDGDDSVRAAVTRKRLDRMIEITGELAGLREQIGELVAASGSSLTTIYGIGPFVAAGTPRLPEETAERPADVAGAGRTTLRRSFSAHRRRHGRPTAALRAVAD